VLSWHTAGGSLGIVAVPLLLSAVVTVAGWRWALMILGMALAFFAISYGLGSVWTAVIGWVISTAGFPAAFAVMAASFAAAAIIIAAAVRDRPAPRSRPQGSMPSAGKGHALSP
jgi:hypothetical protein